MALASVLTPLGATSIAVAQEGAQGVLEEVVVTARRREESLQQIPLAVAAFSGETLEAAGVERIESMNAIAPNLAVHGGSGNQVESQAAFMIRGMEGVSVYVDGIDQTSATGLFTMGILDVERIEVLRGPQGTLFGSASLGGAINYVTRRPAEEFGANIKARFGDFNRREIGATVDLPVTDTFLTKFTYFDNQRDGYVLSAINGQDYGDINDQFLRADLLFHATDNLSIRYAYDTSNQDRHEGARQTWEIGPKTIVDPSQGGAVVDPGGPGFDPTDPNYVNTNAAAQAWENSFGILFDNQHAASNYPGGELGQYETLMSHTSNAFQLDMKRHILDVDWTINDRLRARALYGNRRTETYRIVEHDSTSSTNFGDRAYYEDFRDESLELQLHGSFGADDQFNWVVGYIQQEQDYKDRDQRLNLNTMVCDLFSAGNRNIYGITLENEASCFNARMRGLGVEDQFQATSSMTHAQIAALWNQVVTLSPSYYGVHTWDYSTAVGGNTQTGSASRFDLGSSEAIFADLTWDITDRLTLSVGMRDQTDHDDGEYDFTPDERYPFNNITATLASPFAGTVNPTPRDGSTSEYSGTTGRLSLQYQWTDSLMTYVTLANGYAPGGTGSPASSLQSLQALDTPAGWSWGEQTVENFEIGLKSEWMDGRLRANVTAFFTDWKNATAYSYPATIYWDVDGDGRANDGDLDNDGVQETTATGLIPCFNRCDATGLWEVYFVAGMDQTAVGGVEISGIELEMQWLATDNLQLGLNLGTLDSKITDIGPAALGVVPAMLPGDKFRGMPDMNYKFWGEYDWSLPNGANLRLRGDYTWTDDVLIGSGKLWTALIPSFGLVNARLVYDTGQNWRVTLAGTNLTDEWYTLTGFKSQAQQVFQGSVGRPRELYLGFDFDF